MAYLLGCGADSMLNDFLWNRAKRGGSIAGLQGLLSDEDELGMKG